MTPLAAYILEQAQRAHDEQLSEQEFLAGFDERLVDATKVRTPSFGLALSEIRRGGQWPWSEPSEPETREAKDPAPDELTLRRRRVVAAMDELAAACEDLTGLFRRLGRDVRGDLLVEIERGASASDIVRSLFLAEHRESLKAAAFRLEKSRHEFQREMFILSTAEGESPAEIAQAWGISRQLVSRTMKERR